jgi:hypothetical protein
LSVRRQRPSDADIRTPASALHAPEALTVAFSERRWRNTARIQLHAAPALSAVNVRNEFTRAVENRHARQYVANG